MNEIVVFGATGQVGAEVVRSLLSKGVRPRVFTRNAAQAKLLFGDSIYIVEGDFEDEGSIRQTVEGIESLFLSSPVNPQQVVWQGRVLSAVADAKPLVIKLSGLATSLNSYVDSGRWHAETEATIQQLEIPHVFLHPNFFLQNLARTIPAALEKGVLAASNQDALIAPVDVRDIGAVAARLLTGQVDRLCSTLKLTARDSFSFRELASLLGELTGKKIRLIERTDEDARHLLAKGGMPSWHIDILMQFNRAFREGLGAEVFDDVESVLNRPPIGVSSYVETLIENSLSLMLTDFVPQVYRTTTLLLIKRLWSGSGLVFSILAVYSLSKQCGTDPHERSNKKSLSCLQSL